MFNAKIISTGSYLPNKILTNEALSVLVDTSDEWITKRTGIKKRHIAAENEFVHNLGANAAKNIISNANIDASSIDLIVTGTTTALYSTPSASCIIQKEISAINAFAFDVNAACCSFTNALAIASSFIKCGKYKRALVIGSDTISKLIDWTDRKTCILFGDGAAGVLLERSEYPGIVDEAIFSDGSRFDALLAGHVIESENKSKLNNYLAMNGREIFNFAIKAVPDSINQLLYKCKCSLDDVKYIIPHQANIRIVQGIADSLKIPMSRFYINLLEYGNTSSASIPIALDEMNKKSMLNTGEKIIIAAFGGGLTWSSILIKW